METVLRTSENMKKCLCSACPSYTTKCKIKNYPINMMKLVDGIENVEHFEKMFCAFGKSNCISENRGCLCEQCDVYNENNLSKEDSHEPYGSRNDGFNGAKRPKSPFAKGGFRGNVNMMRHHYIKGDKKALPKNGKALLLG